MIEFSHYRLDPRAERLWRGSHPVALRPKAWALLRYLAERPGVLVTKDELHGALWSDTVVSDDTLTRTVAELRRALRDDPRTPRIIETVHRRGFRFIAAAQELERARLAPPLDGAPDAPPGPEPAILVGRDGELARLQALLKQARGGQRQIVFVEGEAGLGKSALVEAFLRVTRAGPDRVLIGYGQCVEQCGQREPYMAVLEAVERLSQGSSAHRLQSALRAVAPSWLAQMSSLQTPAEADRLRRSADATPQRMLREFAGLVEAISVDYVVLLVLEDLHWSDWATVDLVSVLAQRPERARLMLVATYRPAHAAATDHPIQQTVTTLRARRRCVEIALEYLSPAEVASYLERRSGSARVDDDVADVVHDRTDGNPLFMVVLVDHLLARGWLAVDQGLWRLTAARETIEQDIPGNLRQMIEAQLRFVSPAERDALEVASVVGVVFDAPAVAAGLDGPSEAAESICHGLSTAQRWLRYLGSAEWPDGSLAARYAFSHSLYQRVLYDGLSPSRRATLHQRIGERLETGHAGQTFEVSAELAKHFQGGRDQRRSLIYLEQAALRAYARRAHADVVGCIKAALDVLRHVPVTAERARDELRLRRLYAMVLSQTAGYSASALLENLRRMQGLCSELDVPEALCDVLGSLCLLYANRGDLVEAERIASRLLELAERTTASAALHGRFLRGAVALWTGNLNAAEPLLKRALTSPATREESDRPYGVDPVVAVRSFEGLRRWVTGDADGAVALQREALTLAARHGNPFTLAHATTFSALAFALDGQWTEASTIASRAVDLSDEYEFPRWLGTALVIRGRALVEEGRGAHALGELREGLDLLGRSRLRLGNSILLAFLAAACLRLDRVEEALAAADLGLTHCRDTGERFLEAELWSLKGEGLLRCLPAAADARFTLTREAEGCFDTARAVAVAQGAHMLARRAADRRVDGAAVGGIALT